MVVHASQVLLLTNSKSPGTRKRAPTKQIIGGPSSKVRYFSMHMITSLFAFSCLSDLLTCLLLCADLCHFIRQFLCCLLASTVKLGNDTDGNAINTPMSNMLPMVDPSEIVWGGWDINSMNLGDAMKRSQVLEYDLQK